VRTSARLKEAPFRVLVMHRPEWGWVAGENSKWTRLSNAAGIELAIAGHKHAFSRKPPEEDAKSTVLVVDQVARVNASDTGLKVAVKGIGGGAVDAFTLKRR
jgi:hypothetical protein